MGVELNETPLPPQAAEWITPWRVVEYGTWNPDTGDFDKRMRWARDYSLRWPIGTEVGPYVEGTTEPLGD